MLRLRRLPELLVPALLVLATALLGLAVSTALEAYFLDTLVKVSIVVALYVFIGNSGVLSFGHVSFIAVGVWVAGVLTVPEEPEERDHAGPRALPPARARSATSSSLLLAAVAGLVFAFVVGLPLMRLSGLAAGIATFGVLEITNNVLRYWQSIGPGLNAFSSVPATTGIWQAAIGALICVAVAFAYQRSRFGRQLRATREDPAAASAAGISIYRQRLLAFALSGGLAGFAGGLYVHLLPVEIDSLYLDLTFITLAMLVVGGSGSLLGRGRGRARGERRSTRSSRRRRTASTSSAGTSTCRRAPPDRRRRADGGRARAAARRPHRWPRAVAAAPPSVPSRPAVAGACGVSDYSDLEVSPDVVLVRGLLEADRSFAEAIDESPRRSTRSGSRTRCAPSRPAS